MRSQTITVLGIYEPDTKLGVHLQVKDKSSAVLLSEISQFIEPGSQIISDAIASYKRLPEDGYEDGVVVRDVCQCISDANETNELWSVAGKSKP